MNRSVIALGAAALACLAVPASAHFQLLYTPEVNIEQPGDLPFKLIFWHPMDVGHAMDMGKPDAFFQIHKGERTDLMDTLRPATFQASAENSAKAFDSTIKVRRNGDYIFCLAPAPYYEKSEDIYIQQLTKSFVNKGGIPTGWNEPVGLPTEIVPLNKPTNVIAGSTFSGLLLAEGRPVPDAEIEIEYMAAPPDMATGKPGEPSVQPMPGGSIVAITDSRGVFTFGIPKAGFWGFAALGSGPLKEFQGKELSQDAVIWIRAFDLK